jgi:Tol biopolymer transport system component
MTIATGTRLGPYEILAALGAGGMGEVYRARDTRLDRTVAVKILPQQLSSNYERRQRFDREARAISSLTHPHICALYDVGQQDGIDYLVMEYIEGESLADRLKKGPLPLNQALSYGIQVADALDKAHRAGIVHRDLKPANIMLTRSGAKLLDFGLAKLVAGDSQAVPGNLSNLATRRPDLTGEGTIIGTLQYMAPEQLEGKEADRRSDIFAFGEVVYEMATGKRAFTGENQASLIGAILHTEPPPISTIQPMTPPALDLLVQTCLAKDADERWQTAHDVKVQLGWMAEGAGGPGPIAGQRKRKDRVAAVVAAIAVLALLLSLPFAITHLREAPPDTRVIKFPLPPPEKATFGDIAVSPDGRWLAFTAATGGKDQLWVRPLNGLAPQLLGGTEGASYPFWSTDSSFIGFFASGKLKKIAVTGGPPQTLCDAGVAAGGTWNRDGVIVFATSGFGLYRVSAIGDATPLMPLDTARQEVNHLSPSFLPDGRHFLYYIRSGRKETRGTYLGSLDNGVKERLLGADLNAVYAEPGYLLFMRERALLAQPFDPLQLKLTGEPFPVAERVGIEPNYELGNFSVSDTGVLVYDPSPNRQSKQLLWVDRGGKSIGSLGAGGSYARPWLSPDEKRVAVDRLDPQPGTNDIWLQNVAGGNPQRFTFDPANDFLPVWSPDGSRIVWSSNREGATDLYQKASSGAGQDEPLLKSSNRKFPTDWSLDGRFIIYTEIDPKTNRDIWVLPLFGDGKPFPFLRTEANETGGQLSPDGRWIAYASDELGGYEVYVQSFPKGGGKRQVSTKGGTGPCWRRDGKELFYYSSDGKLMAAEVKSGASFEAGVPSALFEFRSGNATVTVAPYTVTADGQRFLLNTVVDESGGAPLTVVINWTAELKR